MKQVEKVSIGGYAFMLDKEASEKIGQYITELEAHYLSRPEGKEVMESIEERIAELLLERCGKDRVASTADVQYVIDIIGRPEKIEENDPEPEQSGEKPRKKLYRDMENKRLGQYFTGKHSVSWSPGRQGAWESEHRPLGMPCFSPLITEMKKLRPR